MDDERWLYYDWLLNHIKLRNNISLYNDILEILFSTEFIWLISGDDNRASDGLYLRMAFFNETGIEYISPDGCSILECLVAFSGVLEFQTGDPKAYWFWVMISNLGLLDDGIGVNIIDDILHNFIWRRFDYYGNGSIFPNPWTKQDQRKVEMLYQFFEFYLNQMDE